MPRKVKYTKELLESIVPHCVSYAEVLKKLGLRQAGGNYASIQRNVEKFGIDTSHMLHQAANAGREFKAFQDLTSKASIRTRLIELRGRQCESCLRTHWLGKLITLEVDHIDGNNRNNEESNLKLLCPNCHSQTPTWRNRKRVNT